GVGYGTLRGLVSGGIQSQLTGQRPNWSAIAAESFGSALGDQVASGLQKRDQQRQQQQQRLAEAMQEQLSTAQQTRYAQNGVIVADGGQRLVWSEILDDGGPRFAVPSKVEQQRRAELEDLLDPLYPSASNMMTIEIVGGRKAVQEPGPLRRYAGSLTDTLIDGTLGTAQFISDQGYLAANLLSGGLIDDRGAAARNVALVRGLPDALGKTAGELMYYAKSPGELSAEQAGALTGNALLSWLPGGRLLRGSSLSVEAGVGTRLLARDAAEAFGPRLDRLAEQSTPGLRMYAVPEGGTVPNNISTASRLGEAGAVGDLLYGARAGEGLPGAAGVAIPSRPMPVQLANLTEKHGVEFAATYKYGPGTNGGGGQYYLYSGERGAVEVPISANEMLIYHTHPGGTAFASQADMDVLNLLKLAGSPQRSSQIVPVGKDVVRFGPKGWGY
ncbi:hypothetical protein, partial [Chromobacterium haemolyticum]